MNGTPPTPSPKPKWGRIGTVVRRTSSKFIKTSGKTESDGDSDSTSLRQSPSFEVIPTNASLNLSPNPSSTPPTKSKIGRIGRAVRRASTKLSVSRQGTPSTERDSDSVSLKRTASYEFIASPLSLPIKTVEVTLPSPIAESPAREAEAIQQETVGPSPLTQLSLPLQEAEEPAVPEVQAIPPTVIEEQPSRIVEYVTATSDPSAEIPQAVVQALDVATPLIVDTAPENMEVPVHDHPEVDAPSNSWKADPVSTPATEESIVIIDPSAMDIPASIVAFDESVQDAIPGALPLKYQDPLYYHPDTLEAKVMFKAEDKPEEKATSELDTPIDAGRMDLPSQIEIPAAPEEVRPSDLQTFPMNAITPTKIDYTQEAEVKQPQHHSTSSTDSTMDNSFASVEVSSASLFAVPPIVDHPVPAPPPTNEKPISVNLYPPPPPITSRISQPPLAHTVDHFPSPTPNAHLLVDPEKATASRPVKKEATPSLKSIIKPSRPNGAVSTTNSAFEDFRVKTIVVVVGAVASIVATAMLFLRR